MTNSLEDYLEAIYLLVQANGYTRVRDIALALNVKTPSVIKAVFELKKEDYVTQEPYGAVVLTKAGARIARKILGRHTLLKKFLMLLKVSDKTAERDACAMEHFLSPQTLTRITAFVKASERKDSSQSAQRTQSFKQD